MDWSSSSATSPHENISPVCQQGQQAQISHEQLRDQPVKGMCHSSSIKALNESSIIMSSGRPNSDRNGSCKKAAPLKLQDSENSLPQKLRKMDSSEAHVSSQRSGISVSSQNKSYNQTDHQESDLKTSKNLLSNNPDRKTTSTNNLQSRQTKSEGGKHTFKKTLQPNIIIFIQNELFN